MTVTTVEALSVEELYEKYIKPRSLRERLQLIALISDEAALGVENRPRRRERSILELEGLGAELWENVDAQEYVNQLRDEWGEYQ